MSEQRESEARTESFFSNRSSLSLELGDFILFERDSNSDSTHYCFPGKIKDLITRDVVDELTKLVLVNATYFKGKWEQQFKEEDTVEAPFRISTVMLQKTDGLTLCSLPPGMRTYHFGISEGIHFKCTRSFWRSKLILIVVIY